VVRWQEFRAHVAALRARLDRQPAGAWVLLSEDAYLFSVGLLGLWHSGRHAISPPNQQPESLRALEKSAAGVLSDCPSLFFDGIAVTPIIDPGVGPPSDALLEASPLSPDALALMLYTSGSTRSEKPVIKCIRHLEEELRGLAQTWDELLGDASVFATASHQHLYGLLFGVLWPLCSGRPFHAYPFLHAGELLPRLQAAKQSVLASVPTHLRRLVRHESVSTLRDHCKVVFSSGGPLASETAHNLAQALGHAPLEVLGSTETGGIAWRRQQPGEVESLWQPFNRVRVSCDPQVGTARVDSPFVSAPSEGGAFLTGDRISLRTDGRFELLGRCDRIVKVGEKRLDLERMESQLAEHPGISQLALTTIERDGEQRVAAAIVPSERGWEQIRLEGKRAFYRAIRTALAEAWDPVLHPRHWRALQSLPENPQGKATRDALERLFQPPAEKTPFADRPEILEELRGDDFLERVCFAPSDLSCFPGHFPGFSLVPGVLQLDWAMDIAADLLGEIPRVEEIETLKLHTPILPKSRFRIRVRTEPGNRITFRIWNDETNFANGRIRLATLGRVDS
jgi:acyl-CoA synthetase (AMP-forming)/AMP-acid ligase II/3-hydroxymyristoyl/3-hydroxydecanoyl-(acyl carrier protein) dehydratase